MGCTSSGVISNMRGLKWILTKEDAITPTTAVGRPAILARIFRAFFSFLYSSKGIILRLRSPPDCDDVTDNHLVDGAAELGARPPSAVRLLQCDIVFSSRTELQRGPGAAHLGGKLYRIFKVAMTRVRACPVPFRSRFWE